MDRASRIGQILLWLRSGYSYADVARKLGVSRQRVWQIAKRYKLTPTPVFSAGEAAKKWNCSEATVHELIRRGIVRAEKKGRYWNILTKENPRLCLICGKPIPKGRMKYCSPNHNELATLKNRKQGMWRRFRERLKHPEARKLQSFHGRA